MPLGLLSDQDFDRELESLKGPVKESPRPEKGRGTGSTEVPESLRKIIGEEAVINGPEEAMKIARMFDISRSSVSAYTNGATSTASYNTPSKGIIDHINKSRKRNIKRASHVLNQALSAITQEKLDYTDARDLSGIAKDMSTVIKNLEPPQPKNPEEGGSRAPQFVIYAPSFRDERVFEQIVVQE